MYDGENIVGTGEIDSSCSGWVYLPADIYGNSKNLTFQYVSLACTLQFQDGTTNSKKTWQIPSFRQ